METERVPSLHSLCCALVGEAVLTLENAPRVARVGGGRHARPLQAALVWLRRERPHRTLLCGVGVCAVSCVYGFTSVIV